MLSRPLSSSPLPKSVGRLTRRIDAVRGSDVRRFQADEGASAEHAAQVPGAAGADEVPRLAPGEGGDAARRAHRGTDAVATTGGLCGLDIPGIRALFHLFVGQLGGVFRRLVGGFYGLAGGLFDLVHGHVHGVFRGSRDLFDGFFLDLFFDHLGVGPLRDQENRADSDHGRPRAPFKAPAGSTNLMIRDGLHVVLPF